MPDIIQNDIERHELQLELKSNYKSQHLEINDSEDQPIFKDMKENRIEIVGNVISTGK